MKTRVYRNVIAKPEAKRQLRKPVRRWKDNIKIYLKNGM